MNWGKKKIQIIIILCFGGTFWDHEKWVKYSNAAMGTRRRGIIAAANTRCFYGIWKGGNDTKETKGWEGQPRCRLTVILNSSVAIVLVIEELQAILSTVLHDLLYTGLIRNLWHKPDIIINKLCLQSFCLWLNL